MATIMAWLVLIGVGAAVLAYYMDAVEGDEDGEDDYVPGARLRP